MPTVIDSLIITLGLDPSNFNKGKKDAARALIDTKREVKSTADEIGKSVATLTRQFVSLFLVVKGFQDLVHYFERVSESTRELGINSKNLGIAAADLRDWQNAAILAGGSAAEVTKTVDSLQKSIFDLRFNGVVSDQIIFLSRLGVQFQTTAGAARPFTDVMMDTAKAIENSHMDRATSNQFLRSAGFDQGSINLILSGTKALRAYYEQQKRLPQVSEADIQASTRMGQSWDLLVEKIQAAATKLLTHAEPAIDRLFAAFNRGVDWVNANQDKITAWLDKVVDWFAGDGPKNVQGGIGGIIDSFRSLTGTLETLGKVWDNTIGRLQSGGSIDNAFQNSAQRTHDFFARAFDIERATPDKYRSVINAAAIKYGIPAEDLARLLQRESGFDPSKVGAAGERGIAQLRPEYHPNAGQNADADIFEAARTLAENAAYYGRHLKQYGLSSNDDVLNAAFAAYNAGQGRTSDALTGKRRLPASSVAYVNGIRGAGAAANLQRGAAVNGNTTSNNLDVGHITVNTLATDAEGIAGAIHGSIQRKFSVAQVDPGMLS